MLEDGEESVSPVSRRCVEAKTICVFLGIRNLLRLPIIEFGYFHSLSILILCVKSPCVDILASLQGAKFLIEFMFV